MKSSLPGINHEVLAFVMARRQEQGGFGFAPNLPPSVEDTYHALRILETIRPVSEREIDELKGAPGLKAFVTRKEDKENWSLKIVYQYLCLCLFCNIRQNYSWIKGVVGKRIRQKISIPECYYLAKIRREGPSYVTEMLGGTDRDVSFLACSEILNGGGPDGRWSAEEVWMELYLRKGSTEALHGRKRQIIGWLQTCQNPDGGFGFVPGSTSFIENSHSCLRGLFLLGSTPLSLHMAREFVLMCKTRRGGFSRNHGAAPFLDATWHAVASLDLIASLLKSGLRLERNRAV